VDVAAGERLPPQAQAALYQIVREALYAAVRRGPPTRISVSVEDLGSEGVEAVVSDDARGERRQRVFDAIRERARTLNGSLAVTPGPDGGTTVRVRVPLLGEA
jgi:signal transduction histidine kinase